MVTPCTDQFFLCGLLLSCWQQGFPLGCLGPAVHSWHVFFFFSLCDFPVMGQNVSLFLSLGQLGSFEALLCGVVEGTQGSSLSSFLAVRHWPFS